MFKRSILVLFIMGLFISGLIAQPSVQLHISDKTIGSKDHVSVTYEFNNISNPALPAITFNDWQVSGRPSYSQRTRIINGNATSSVSYTFSLYPKHIGTLKVPGISFDYKGKQLRCHDATVKVVRKEHLKKQPGAGRSPLGSILQGMPNMGFPPDIFGMPDAAPPPVSGVVVHQGQSYDQAAAHDFFIKITPSKTSFYIGEPILVDYEFFGATNCTWQPERFPSFNGFSVTDIERKLYPYNIKVNGRDYRAGGIRKVQLVALKTGSLPLDSASVRIQTTFIEASNPADRNRASALIKSKPQTVTVLPLPEQGRPHNFSGAIGQFKIRATVDNNKLPAGENNRLHIHITGTGNLDGVSVPDIKWPEGVQSYDARDSQSVNKTSFPMERSLDFEIPFIGNRKGGVKIPPIVFNFFNPDTKKYVHDSTDTIQIEFTTPLKDNGVTTGLSRRHRTNREYLWIVAAIALLVGAILGFTEWKKKNQKKKGAGSKKDPVSPTDSSTTLKITTAERTAARKTTVREAEGGRSAGSPAESSEKQSQTGQPLRHEADHLQYLPAGLSSKIKAKSDPAKAVEATPPGEQTGLPEKSREELRREAIRELRQRQDPKDFFVLAKAFIIEELQYLLKTSDTDEKRLLQSLADNRPELQEDYRSLIDRCNKALYLPVASDSSRQIVLDKIEAMER